MPDVKQRMIDIVNSVPDNYFDGLKQTEMVFKLMKKTLNQVNVQENTLYDIIYDLFFFAKLQESEDDIKNGRVCTLEELRQHIDELEAKYANNNIG